MVYVLDHYVLGSGNLSSGVLWTDKSASQLELEAADNCKINYVYGILISGL